MCISLVMETIEAELVFDLVVIGSGPAGLALVTRILESRPAALYTEDEHAHLHWLQRGQVNGGGTARPLLRVGQGGTLMGRKGGRETCRCDGVMKILVVDRLGAWMANWDRLFAAYEISHLRSPLFFHPAPFDLDALLAFAERYNVDGGGGGDKRGRGRATRKQTHDDDGLLDRHAHLIEITGCVGKEISKHKQKQNRRRKSNAATAASMGPAVNERDRKDYFVPSTQLFKRFIDEDLVRRYKLDNQGKKWSDSIGPHTAPVQMVKGQVSRLRWTDVHVRGSGSKKAFCVDLDGNDRRRRVAANAVVCAIGPGPTPNVPAFLPKANVDSVSGSGWCHSTQIGLAGRAFPSAKRTLAIVGGGLTSAQLCDVALRKDPHVHVHLIVRRHMQIKPFDVGLSWVGKYGNLEKMLFWQEDDPQARLAKLLAARNGGSITPRYAKLLKSLQQCGRLTVHTCTEVIDAQWHADDGIKDKDDDDGEWTLTLRRRRQSGDEDETSELHVNYIISATGAAPCLDKVPFMADICKDHRHGVAHYGGLPFLTENLQYGEVLPLFFSGAFSALQIGPGAFNLEGMRAAADRIAVRLQEMASPSRQVEEDVATDEASIDAHRPSTYTHFAYDLLPQEIEA